MNATQTAPLEWSLLWTAMKAAPSEWIPTTEAMYWNMLECLPPRTQSKGAFLVGEAETHNASGHAVYACFKQSGDDFSAKYMTLAEFRA